MTDNKNICLVHAIPEKAPSVSNIKQTLLGSSWDVESKHIDKSGLKATNMLFKGLNSAILSFKIILLGINLRYVRKPDLVILHKTLPKDLFEYFLKINFNEKIFTRILSPINLVYSTYDADYLSELGSIELIKRSDLVIATSKNIEKKAKSLKSNENVKYMPPSVDTNLFEPFKNIDVEKTKFTIGWVGNAKTHQEDIKIISEIFQEYTIDDIKIIIVLGGHDLPEKIEKRLSQINQEVKLIRHLPREDIPKIINTFDVGIAPLERTEYNEARSSEKIREYMACGVPVIASKTVENMRLVDKAGLLPESISEWRDAITRMYKEDDLRNEMVENAVENAVENYSIPIIRSNLEKELEKLMND